ncbi:MAG: hypothetical protein ACREC0_03165 [Methylocella sp.]
MANRNEQPQTMANDFAALLKLEIIHRKTSKVAIKAHDCTQAPYGRAAPDRKGIARILTFKPSIGNSCCINR